VPVPKFFQERGETLERNNDITRDGKRFLKRYRGWISRCVRSSRRTADSGGLELVRGAMRFLSAPVAFSRPTDPCRIQACSFD